MQILKFVVITTKNSRQTQVNGWSRYLKFVDSLCRGVVFEWAERPKDIVHHQGVQLKFQASLPFGGKASAKAS